MDKFSNSWTRRELPCNSSRKFKIFTYVKVEGYYIAYNMRIFKWVIIKS